MLWCRFNALQCVINVYIIKNKKQMKNKVDLIGRVGRIDTKEIESGKIVTISLATSEKYKNKSGEKVENTEWHNLKMFGNVATIAAKYVNKGDLISVEGKIQTRKHEDKYYTNIIVINLLMLGGKKSETFAQNEPDESDRGVDELPF